ncbi:soma ferritin-like isoform X1 [Acanthaster planci]|uniref:Ferritin n=2 Tax=Acanthaster planci TaxID=133434 RepID=A0A8B7Y548_ACAPL|nr:soma ferritin-like isoform X1 [Acanthaster planci]
MENPTAIRQNFSRECESGINRQINLQLYSSYVYLAMASYFNRSEVALPGFHSYCKGLSDSKRDVAMELMAYQNKRGGRVCLQDIKSPAQEFSNGQKALEAALQLEKDVNKSWLELDEVAGNAKDEQFAAFIDDYLQAQTDQIKELGDHLANSIRAGPNLGEYIFDKESLSS